MLLGAAVLLMMSVIASKASGRFGIPALLLFLAVGMLAGSQGPGGIQFDDAGIAQAIGVISLLFILFAGGLDTDWKSVRPIILPGLSLSTLGVLITTFLVGGFATWILHFDWLEGLLLGATVSSTDAAAVFTVLRSRNLDFGGSIRSVLEFESGSNDPMAVFLTVSLLNLYLGKNTGAGLIFGFVQQMTLGLAAGWAGGKAARFLINKLSLRFEGLYPVLTISIVLSVFGLTHLIGGNGFLAVYIAGLVLAQESFLHKQSLVMFHDGLAWLMQIAMFLVLGLLVSPGQLKDVALAGILISLFLVFIARPLSVFTSLLPFKFNWREQTLISWLGLRGAVPIILATYPLLAGTSQSKLIFNLVFFIVITSVLLQGLSVPFVAKRLKLGTPTGPSLRPALNQIPSQHMKSDLVEVEIPKNSPISGKSVVELKFPRDSLIVLIYRQEQVIVPRGQTRVMSGDHLLMFAGPEQAPRIQQILSANFPETP